MFHNGPGVLHNDPGMLPQWPQGAPTTDLECSMQLHMQVFLMFSPPHCLQLQPKPAQLISATCICPFLPRSLALTDAFTHPLPRPAAQVDSCQRPMSTTHRTSGNHRMYDSRSFRFLGHPVPGSTFPWLVKSSKEN